MSLTLVMGLTMMFSCMVTAQFREVPLEAANWTSCHEFVNNTTLNPDKLLDIEWKVFFFWSPETEASYSIMFSRPSPLLVDRFRVELDKELEPPANWSNAELFMESSIELSALFLRTPTPGIYRVIPATAFEFAVKTPLLIFALKLVEPGVLGLSNCRYRLCYAFAPSDNMPHHNELAKMASTLNFYNPYNRSHITFPSRKPTDIPYSQSYAAAADMSDDDQDEDLEMEQDLGRIDFF